MIKQKVVLEVKVGERSYSMECYADSPLGEIYDALTQMKSFIVGKVVEAQKAEEKPKE